VATTDLARRLRVPALRGWRRGAHAPGGAGTRAAAVPAELSSANAVARWMLVAISVLSIWLVAYALVFSGLQEKRAQHDLYAKFREQLALQTARIGPDVNGVPIPAGEPVAMLSAPAIGLDHVVVVEGTAADEMRSGPGHLRSTVLPGQAGVAVVYGRAVTFGAPFASVTSLHTGDEIFAVTGQGRFVYQVTGVRRAGDPYPAPLATGGGQLTLVTSEGSGWRSGWAPTGTVFVDALLVRPASGAASGGHLAAVPPEEATMKGDSSKLIVVVLWLQGLLLAAIAMVWAWRRWGAWQTWIVGSAVVIALLWGASNSAALLVPNLI
jgi:sortase A